MKKATCCEDPQPIVTTHHSFYAVLPALILGALVAIGAEALTRHLGAEGLPVKLSPEISITLPVSLLCLLVFWARPILLLFDAKHDIACHHIRSVTGRCSLKRQFVEIPFEDMLGARATQTIMERILGVGSVLVWTASADKPDLMMKGIRNPDEIAHLVSNRIDRANLKRERRHNN